MEMLNCGQIIFVLLKILLFYLLFISLLLLKIPV